MDESTSRKKIRKIESKVKKNESEKITCTIICIYLREKAGHNFLLKFHYDIEY